MEPKDLIPISAVEIVQQATAWARSIQVVEIQTAEQAEQANTLFRELNGYIKEIETARTRTKEPFLQKGREVDGYFKQPQNDLSNLKAKIEQAIRVYKAKTEAARIAEQNRLNKEAADRQRKIEDAAQAERDKAEKLRQDALKAENEAEAAKLRAQADKADQRAETKQEKASLVIASVAQSAAPRLDGTSVRQNWKCQINEQENFVKFAVETGRLNLLMPNNITCSAWAKSLKKEQVFPWGRIFNDEKLVGRAI